MVDFHWKNEANRWRSEICLIRFYADSLLISKAVNGMLPEYLIDLFVVRNNVNCLRGTNKLVIPRKKTLNFGLKSTTFICAKVWNSLPDELRSTTTH